jgi:hypothetical protein
VITMSNLDYLNDYLETHPPKSNLQYVEDFLNHRSNLPLLDEFLNSKNTVSSPEPSGHGRSNELHDSDTDGATPPSSCTCSDRNSSDITYTQDDNIRRGLSAIPEENFATNVASEWQLPSVYDVMDAASELSHPVLFLALYYTY